MANIQLLCERYNGANRKYISQNYPNLGKTLTVEEDYYGLYDNTYVNATMAAGTTPDNYFSTATLVAKDKVSIRDGFCATFNLNDGMSFGRNESSGMNGLVSFAWTSCDMGFWSDYHNGYTRAFPDNLAFCTYRLDTQNFDDDTYKGGGLAPSLWNNKTETYSMISYGDCGFTLTLYPDKDANENSVVGRKVKHFKLCVKKKDYSVKNKSAEAHIVETNNNVIVYEDDLPEEVDLTDISSIALSSRDELGYVNIFLNGVNIVSFFVEENCSLANMNEAYFTTCVMGDVFSKPDFTFYSMNGVLMAFHGNKVGSIETMLNNLTAKADMDTVSTDLLESIVDTYPSDDGSEDEEYDALYHNLSIYDMISNILTNNE